MKKLSILLFSLIIIFAAAPPLKAQQPYPLSDSQKGVKVSTDVFAVAMPVATLAGLIAVNDWTGLKQGAFAAVTTVGFTYLLKYSINKTRPDGSDRHSFPSMHSADVFANAAFLQRRFGWEIGAPAYAVAVYVAWGRVYSKKHDFWDVFTGALIGSVSAYVFTRPFAKKHELSIVPYADTERFGISASMVF